MSDETRVLELDKYQHRAVVKIINDKRNELLKNNEHSDFVTEILEKALYAPTKKKSILKRKKYRDER